MEWMHQDRPGIETSGVQCTEQQGKTKKQALKCVMRRLVGIVFRMMKDKSEYVEPIDIINEIKTKNKVVDSND